MSDHAARALIGWRTSFGVVIISMEGGENHEPPRFCIEVNVPRGGRKLAVLRLQHGSTGDLLCKIVCFNQLFGDMIIFSITFLMFYNFLFLCPPLFPLRSLH